MLTSGHLLAGRYRLGRRIAVGGMGEVWDAVDVRLDRSVAVKVLKPELCGDAEFLHRFRTEARTTAALNHPGIAAVHDYGETAAVPDGPEDTAYLVMELVEGEPLAAILARKGRISADYVLDMLEQAGLALQAAHQRGLVHRDVKPGNILVCPDGKVKLTDFGIAKAVDAAPVTRSGMVMGTAHYIAPEQAVGREAAPASDVYSLAVVGYECLMGHRPFLSDNAVTVAMMHIREVPPPLPPDVPPGARALIEATLVKDPRRRYGTGGEFAAAVASVRAGLPLPPPSGLALPPPRQPPQPMTRGAHSSGVRPIPNLVAPPAPVTAPGMSGVPTGSMYPVDAAVPGLPTSRTGGAPRWSTWILVAIIVVLVLIVVGLLTWYVGQNQPQGQPPVRSSDEVTLASLDSPRQVGQTTPGHPMIAAAHGRVVHPASRSVRHASTVSDRGHSPRPGAAYREVGGTAGGAVVACHTHHLWIGRMGRSLTRIGTTYR